MIPRSWCVVRLPLARRHSPRFGMSTAGASVASSTRSGTSGRSGDRSAPGRLPEASGSAASTLEMSLGWRGDTVVYLLSAALSPDSGGGDWRGFRHLFDE